MLQTFVLTILSAVAASLLVVQWRLLRGGSVEKAQLHLRASIGVAAVALASGAAMFALRTDASLSQGLGLLSVGLAPESVERIAIVRAALWGMGGVAIAVAILAWRLPVPRRWLVSQTADLQRLARRIHTDFDTFRTDPAGHGLSTRLAVALLLLGAAIRVLRATRPMSPDESTTVVWFASRSPLDIMSDYSIPNNHILHSLLVWMSHRVFGFNEFATRLPSLFAGILLVAVVAWLTYKLFGTGPAVVAAALAASSPPLVEYAAQARGYTLSALLLSLALVFLLYAQEDPGARSPWALYALCVAAALLTVPSSAMGVYFIGFWFLATYPRDVATVRRPLAWTAAAGILTVLLYLPALVRSGWRSVLANPYVIAEHWETMLRRLSELTVELRECWTGALPGRAAACFLLVTLMGLGRRGREQHKGAAIGVALLGTLLVLLTVNRVVPPLRSLLSVLPFVLVLAAAGLHACLAPFGRAAARLQLVAAVVVAVSWIGLLEWRARQLMLRPRIALWRDGGDDAGRCCAEGYYPDAEAVAAFAKRHATARAPVAMQAFEGGSEAVRFYAIGFGVPITRIHRFDLRAGMGQLADYDSVFVASRGAPRDTSALVHTAKVLKVPVQQLESRVTARFIAGPAPASTFAILTLLPTARASLAVNRKPFDVLEYPRAN